MKKTTKILRRYLFKINIFLVCGRKGIKLWAFFLFLGSIMVHLTSLLIIIEHI